MTNIDKFSACYWVHQLQKALNEGTGQRGKSLKNLYDSIKDDKDLRAIGAVFDENKYPPLPKIFDKDGMVQLIKDGRLSENIEEHLNDQPLAQLLYAVAWKNGDLNKLGSLVLGIGDDDGGKIDEVRNGSYVFYQFGRHLIDRKQPIVDQHTVRAYKLLKLCECSNDPSEEKLGKIRKSGKPGKKIFKEYLDWVKKVLPEDTEGLVDALSHLDKIMFTIGKAMSKK